MFVLLTIKPRISPFYGDDAGLLVIVVPRGCDPWPAVIADRRAPVCLHVCLSWYAIWFCIRCYPCLDTMLMHVALYAVAMALHATAAACCRHWRDKRDGPRRGTQAGIQKICVRGLFTLRFRA